MWENDIDTRLAVLKPEYHIVSLRKGHFFFFLNILHIFVFEAQVRHFGLGGRKEAAPGFQKSAVVWGKQSTSTHRS